MYFFVEIWKTLCLVSFPGIFVPGFTLHFNEKKFFPEYNLASERVTERSRWNLSWAEIRDLYCEKKNSETRNQQVRKKISSNWEAYGFSDFNGDTNTSGARSERWFREIRPLHIIRRYEGSVAN